MNEMTAPVRFGIGASVSRIEDQNLITGQGNYVGDITPEGTVIGYVLRSAAEFYLVGAVGSPDYQSRSIRNLLVAPVREHSRKPDEMHRQLEAMVPGPYAELFGRQQRPGWDVWGNETTKFGDAA